MKLEERPQYTVGSHMRRYISLNCPSTKSIASTTLDISEIQILRVFCYGYGGNLSYLKYRRRKLFGQELGEAEGKRHTTTAIFIVILQ